MNTSCRMRLDDCQDSDTANIVTEFAGDNDAFHEAFGGAYQILIENGYQPDSLRVALSSDNSTDSKPHNNSSDAASATALPALILIMTMIMITMIPLI